MAVMRPVALITGASSGIGMELARIFARHGRQQGYELALVARGEAALHALADRIEAEAGLRPHVFPADLGRLDAGARLGSELAAHGLEPAYVVNNAGFGLAGAAHTLSRAEQLSMIDVNVRALTDLSLRWADHVAAHRGGILNVASIAAFMPGPGMAVYYATKAYVVSFSQALHQELKPLGVRVTALCPGPVPTEFQARSGMQLPAIARLMTQSAEAVAEAGHAGLMAGQRLVVPGVLNKVVRLVLGIAPTRLVLAGAHIRGRRPDAPPRWREEA